MKYIWQQYDNEITRAPDKVPIFTSIMPKSSPNTMFGHLLEWSQSSPYPMFAHLLESSHRDDSNKWSKIGFGKEITQGVSI